MKITRPGEPHPHSDPDYWAFLDEYHQVAPKRRARPTKPSKRGNSALNRYQESLLLQHAWDTLDVLRAHWKDLEPYERRNVRESWHTFLEAASMIDLDDLAGTDPHDARNIELPEYGPTARQPGR